MKIWVQPFSVYHELTFSICVQCHFLNCFLPFFYCGILCRITFHFAYYSILCVFSPHSPVSLSFSLSSLKMKITEFIRHDFLPTTLWQAYSLRLAKGDMFFCFCFINDNTVSQSITLSIILFFLEFESEYLDGCSGDQSSPLWQFAFQGESFVLLPRRREKVQFSAFSISFVFSFFLCQNVSSVLIFLFFIAWMGVLLSFSYFLFPARISFSLFVFFCPFPLNVKDLSGLKDIPGPICAF